MGSLKSFSSVQEHQEIKIELNVISMIQYDYTTITKVLFRVNRNYI